MKTKALLIAVCVLFVAGAFYAVQSTGAMLFLAGADDDDDGPSGPYDHWYRDVRFGAWEHLGADADVMTATLAQIEQANGTRSNPAQPDTVVALGPGHWLTEWSLVADETLASAQQAATAGDHAAAHERFVQAAIYYNIASYPNLKTSAELEALQQSIDAYEQAGNHVDWTLEKVDVLVEGKPVGAFIHLPEEASQPLPVVMVTGGIDVTLIEHYNYFRDHFNDAGVAMVTFDIPGTGASSDFLLDTNSEKIHSAVLEFVSADDRFDPNRVAVFSSSMGGNPAVKLAVMEPGRISAVVNRCGAIHSMLVASPNELGLLPDMTRDSFATRVGASDLTNYREISTLAKPLSLVEQGILTDEIVTTVPILNVNTHDDPIFPPEDMLMVAHSSLGGEVVFSGAEGHCPEGAEHKAAVANWIIRQLSD